MGLSRRESNARMDLYDMGYEYLCRNFHKFKQSEKIKISLEIVKKAMPYKLDHSGPQETHRKFFENVIRKSHEKQFNRADSSFNKN